MGKPSDPCEPLEFAVRFHPRARRVRIRVSALEGVVVTLPPGAPRSLASQAVESRREWVTGALQRIAPRRRALQAGADSLLPEEVSFAATGETWRVRVSLRQGRPSVSERDGCLHVAASSAEEALAALRRWLTRAARRRLLPMLAAAAEEHAIPFRNASVRCQRSRWGSFSSAGNVSLNRNLLFLSPRAVRSVVLHELCHALHHDHSPAFWRALERMDPGCRETRRELKTGSERVPAWAVLP